MRVFVFIPEIKENADGIQGRPDTDEDQYVMRHLVEELPSSDDHDPSHRQIDDGRDDLIFPRIPGFEKCSGYRQTPQYPKQRMAERIVHVDKDERGIGAGN